MTQIRHITGDVEYWEGYLERLRKQRAGEGADPFLDIAIESAQDSLEAARELEWERQRIRQRPLPGETR